MSEAKDELIPSVEALFPISVIRGSLLMTFATALARAHPNPAALLLAFQRTLAEDEAADLPLSELAPENQEARQHYEQSRDMLLRVLAGRVERQ